MVPVQIDATFKWQQRCRSHREPAVKGVGVHIGVPFLVRGDGALDNSIHLQDNATTKLSHT
eukprot:scaffold499617_cov26-Prasinocladus_malaysianus.AAC.1